MWIMVHVFLRDTELEGIGELGGTLWNAEIEIEGGEVLICGIGTKTGEGREKWRAESGKSC